MVFGKADVFRERRVANLTIGKVLTVLVIVDDKNSPDGI